MTTRDRARAAERDAERLKNAIRRMLMFPVVRSIVLNSPGIASDIQAAMPEFRPQAKP
jgi:hypothetical protein